MLDTLRWWVFFGNELAMRKLHSLPSKGNNAEMVEKVEYKWILAWLVVHSVVLVGVVLFMLFAVVVSVQKTDSMSILLHQRISELVTRMDEQQGNITKLKLQYDPHARIEALEKWQRTYCTGPKIEACAQLDRVDR